jgi:glutamate/tyrosine decarboxylase-like PLP-dependent enzyme
MTDPLLARTAEIASAFFDGLDARPVGATLDPEARGPDGPPEDLLARLGPDLPQQGEPDDVVIERLAAGADPGLVASAGGRFFGFVVGSSLPAAVAADWLVSTWDQNGGFAVLSPLIASAERLVGSWILDVLGLPADAAVGFVTGCQMANATALAAARQSVLARAGWDGARQGLAGAPPIRVVVSSQSHGTIDRALAFIGLGSDRVIRVACDEQGRMIAGGLDEALRDGDGPAIVCGQAGNVNTGSFDPLEDLSAVCRRHGAWLHVDGAFGLWAAAGGSTRHLVAGVEGADSWATDAHKWLNVPYDAGMVIVRDRTALRQVTRYPGEYLVRTEGDADPSTFVPESSRRARVVPIYAALRSLGRDGLADLVDRCCAHARRMAGHLEQGGMQILNDVVLNQVLVRCPCPPARSEPAFTDAVIARIQSDGTCWLGGTTWQDLPALRVSVSSWRTTAEDIDVSAEAILCCYAQEAERA